MANVLFSSISGLMRYREDRYSINMLDVLNQSVLLRKLIKPDTPAIYRRGMSTPLLRQGDTIAVVTNGVETLYSYNAPNKTITNVINYIDLMSIKGYAHFEGREIIPDTTPENRNRIFSPLPLISNNLLVAVSSLVSRCIETKVASKDCVPDYVNKLNECLGIIEYSHQELLALARNQLIERQYSQNVRVPISEQDIEDTADKLKSEYEQLHADIQDEFEAIVGQEFIEHIAEKPCSMYYFDDHAMFFYVDRGMDFRLYKYEEARLLKEAENSEDTVGRISETSTYPKFSATYDLF